jgi:hypothetical protein
LPKIRVRLEELHVGMKTLAQRIQRQLQHGESHYAAYEDELQRIWPLSDENRKVKIEQFAKQHGLKLSFYKQGLCAIFEPETTHSVNLPN